MILNEKAIQNTVKFCKRVTDKNYYVCASCMPIESSQLTSVPDASHNVDELFRTLIGLKQKKIQTMIGTTTGTDTSELNQNIDETTKTYNAAKLKQEQTILELDAMEKTQVKEQVEAVEKNNDKNKATLTFIAFGEPLQRTPTMRKNGKFNNNYTDLVQYITDTDREHAKSTIFLLDDNQDELILIKNKLHVDKDDDEGEQMFPTTVEEKSITYHICPNVTYEDGTVSDHEASTRIVNLNEKPLQFTPVYYVIKTDGTKLEEPEEMKTLKASEFTEMPCKIKIDATSEKETGWMLQDKNKNTFKTIKFVLGEWTPDTAVSQRRANPGSYYERVLGVLDKNVYSEAIIIKIFWHDKLSLFEFQRRHSTNNKRASEELNANTVHKQQKISDSSKTDIQTDRLLESIRGGYWFLIPQPNETNGQNTTDCSRIPLTLSSQLHGQNIHNSVNSFYNETITHQIVLNGDVQDNVEYLLATTVSNDNPLNGTRMESFILTTHDMAMKCTQNMKNFIENMPGPLTFNKGFGSTTFKGDQYQVLGYYAPSDNTINYTSFDHNKTIKFHTEQEMTTQTDIVDPLMHANVAPVMDEKVGMAQRRLIRNSRDFDAIKKGRIHVFFLKSPKQPFKILPGSETCPICC